MYIPTILLFFGNSFYIPLYNADMLCPGCGFDSPPEMKYCGMCGTNLNQSCPQCGLLSPRGFLFCGHCGTTLSRLPEEADMVSSHNYLAETENKAKNGKIETAHESSSPTQLSGERRQATVLIADVKGSTPILEKLGSEAWVEVMNQILQIMGDAIYRFGGQVDQFRGDGLIAFFGARSAHEDDPERAVLAALAMQHELKAHASQLHENYDIDLRVRVGINTGEVITANIGNRDQHSEDTAMGGAISLAARLEAAAEPGTILLSHYTYRLVESRFNWEALGEINIRGLSHPVAVYRPLSPAFEAEQQYRLQAHGLWIPIIGRDEEIEAIEQLIVNLRKGLGGISLISGEAGMGKSRLIFEARQRIERDMAVRAARGEKDGALIWLQGRCRSYGQSSPDSMWVDLWQRWLGGGHWVSQEEAIERLRAEVKEVCEDRFGEIYPFLASFLSLPLEEPYATQLKHLDTEGLRSRIFLAMRNWLDILSRREPVVIVFTEVHWAEEASLELLKFCLHSCVQERILFVIVFRPERTMPVWKLKQFVETEYFHRLKTLELSPLTKSQSEDLIHRMIGTSALSEKTRAQIIEKSNGNPYYLTELLHSLIERGILLQDDSGHWQTVEGEISLNLPDSLKSLLLARIDNLSAEEKRVLQFAAVVGPTFWFNILEYLLKNGNDLGKQLTAMQRAQLITERGILPDLGREYTFNSSLIREAAYESILNSQRESLHLSVANYLEQIVQENTLKQQYHGLVAYHFRYGGNCQKELFHALLAAQEAQRMHANVEAIQAYSRALTLMEAGGGENCVPLDGMVDEWKLEALKGLGQTQFGIGNVEEAEKNFRKAIAIGRQGDIPILELTRLFYWLGEVLFWKNVYEEPIHLGEEGLCLLRGNNESVEAALMNQLVAIGCSQLGDYDKFIDFTLRTAGFIQRLPYSEELRPAFAHIISLYGYTLKNPPEARRWLEIMRQKAEENADLRALGEYYDLDGALTFQEGKPDTAIPQHQKAIELFTQVGDSKHLSRAWKSLGISHLQRGEIDDALSCLNKSLEFARIFGNKADYAVGYWYKGQALLCKGDWEGALAAFIKAESKGNDVRFLKKEWALSGQGRVYLAQSMKQEALEIYQKALQYGPTTLFQHPYQANEILSGLEQSFNNTKDFQNFMDRFRGHHPEVYQSPFKQFCLIQGEISQIEHEPLHHEIFESEIDSGWDWVDPVGDCAYTYQKGLVIRAANERNFHHINRSAPRMLWQQPLRGDFTLQAICRPASKNNPAIGGLLVWLSDKYWFCLEMGGRSENEVTLRGFMNNHDFIFGRGITKARKTSLRLERRGHWLSAYCSSDGANWFSAGGCELSTGEPLLLGVHAIGHINRLIYPGAYPEGTAIRFDAFWLWGN